MPLHDVADGHQVVVHDVGEVVGRQTVGLDEHVVIQRVAIHLDVAVEHVVEGRLARGRHVLADDIRLAAAMRRLASSRLTLCRHFLLYL